MYSLPYPGTRLHVHSKVVSSAHRKFSGRFRGGPRGPGPPLRESKKCKRALFCATTPPPHPPNPPLNRICFLRSRKMSATTPPPPLNRIGFFEITEKFCYYPPPPPPLNRVDMALHTKAGPFLRKILDLRLKLVSFLPPIVIPSWCSSTTHSMMRSG